MCTSIYNLACTGKISCCCLLHATDLFEVGNYGEAARKEDQYSGSTACLHGCSLLAWCSLMGSTPVGCGQAVQSL